MTITPKSHPSYYLLHKYWGRKPHNLLSEYIALFTKPGETVLDPFMGSGGVVIESNILSRKGIGVDLNPLACFIVEETLKQPVDEILLRSEFERILRAIPTQVIDLTYTLDKQGNQHIIDNAIWVNGELKKIKYYDGRAKIIKDADDTDRQAVKNAENLLAKYEKDGTITYPTNPIMQYVKRNGKNRIDELFSPRNLLLCAFYMAGVNTVKNKSMRDSLTLIFTSALPNVSRMIPGNETTVTGKSGWQISKFWVPSTHTEKNVIATLRLRMEKYIKGKNELLPLLTNAPYHVYNQSCENLKNIPAGSVDYVFTDPPYGDSISYFALSSFWSSWLERALDYDGEIIYDPYRNKKYDDYSLRLDTAFKQIHRTLKDGGYMSFTFHNRHVRFWKIVIDAVMSAGFELVDVKWINQAVASGTQGINRKNTLTGDFVYTFKKTIATTIPVSKQNGEEYIVDIIEKLLKNNAYISTSKLYEKLIPVLIRNQAYYGSNGKIVDIDKFIKTKYRYTLQPDGKYGWSI